MTDLICHRIESLNAFFNFLKYFDSPYFFFVLIPVIWLGISYQWGVRIFYWYIINLFLNSWLKQMVGWPRPSTDLPELAMFHPKSYGFPSNGAQTCMLLGALLIYYWRTRAAWVIGSLYILLISFSRLYLGVHYPIDILGGWAIGLALAAFFIYTKDPIEKYLAKRGALFGLILTLAIPGALMLLIPTPKIYYNMGSIMGVGLGTYISLKCHLFLSPPQTIHQAAGRSFIALFLLFLFIYLAPAHTFANSFITGLFMSLAASPICKSLIARKIIT